MHAIAFTSESILAVVHTEALRVLSWAPQQEHESRSVQWSGLVADAAIARGAPDLCVCVCVALTLADRALDRLVLLSADGARASVWLAPLCKPGTRLVPEEPAEETAVPLPPPAPLVAAPTGKVKKVRSIDRSTSVCTNHSLAASAAFAGGGGAGTRVAHRQGRGVALEQGRRA